MLSIQHILHSLYTYDMTYLHRYGAWHLRIGIFDFQRKRNLMQSVMAFREDQANS